MKKFIASILSITLLSTCGMILNASAEENVIDESITFDTIGTNNYSFNQLLEIREKISDDILCKIDDLCVTGIPCVFDDNNKYLYSYISVEVQTEESKQIIQDYCKEHNYDDIVLVIVNKNWTQPKIGLIFGENTIGDSENKSITEITVGDSTFPRGDINLDGKVNTLDLLMLKKYLLGLMEW